MSYYKRRSFNKALLPTTVPKQGKWIKRKSKIAGAQRPFNIWFENILKKLNMTVEQFAKEINILNKLHKEPKTEENVIRFWTKDTIPRARLQTKLAQVIAKHSELTMQNVTTQLINVIEDETYFKEI